MLRQFETAAGQKHRPVMNPYSSPNNDNQSRIGTGACENGTFKYNLRKHDRSLFCHKLYDFLFHFVSTPEFGDAASTYAGNRENYQYI